MLRRADQAVLCNRHRDYRKPSVSLTVDDTIPDGVSLLGKELDDLQSGISVEGDGIYGTLKYVTGYTGFSGDPNEQEGNYLALHIDSAVEGATITVELIGGDHPGAVTLDEDRTIILRIKNTHEKIKITATADDTPTVTKTYNLVGLTLTPAE